MGGRGKDRETIRGEIAAMLHADRRSGNLQSPSAYKNRFPGYWDLVDEEFSRVAPPDPAGPTIRDAPAAAAPGVRNESRIGPYQIVREVGRGGMGVVYLAEDTRLHRSVALKVLSPVYASSKDLQTRFQREAAVASRMDHPGICTVYDAGEADGVPFIAMRFVHGETLEHWINAARAAAGMEVRTAIRPSSLPALPAPADAPPPPKPAARPSSGPGTREEIDRLVHLIEKATRAVHAAHEQGLIHRDVKPGNIMVTRDGEPVILDFGLARDEDGTGASITQTGALMGTPAYMSPEQIAAQRIRLDRRTDVYSMGVTLYEALTLRLPFAASSRDSLYQKILVSDPENARKLNPAIPPDLKVVLDKSMEKDRERRYATAEAFAEDLRRVRVREPIQARPASLPTKIHRWVQRNPGVAVPVLGAAAMAVVLPPLALALVEKGRASAKAEMGGFAAGYQGRIYTDPTLANADTILKGADLALKFGDKTLARKKAQEALDQAVNIPEGREITEYAQYLLLKLQD